MDLSVGLKLEIPQVNDKTLALFCAPRETPQFNC